jgi:4-hydroxybenzoate polyprenyltransferase
LPSGRVSIAAAAAFLVAQALIGLAVLVSFNLFSIWLGIASLAIVAVYPLMKRVTSWPQAALGLAFSWGALMGWSATFASLALAPILLYASAFVWTIGYDTIYALQDARDDAIVGIRSTARLFGSRATLGIGAFYAATAALAFTAIEAAGGGAIALIGWLAFCAHLAWQTSQVEGADPAMALRLFRSNRDAGFILFAGVALQGWLSY